MFNFLSSFFSPDSSLGQLTNDLVHCAQLDHAPESTQGLFGFLYDNAKFLLCSANRDNLASVSSVITSVLKGFNATNISKATTEYFQECDINALASHALTFCHKQENHPASVAAHAAYSVNYDLFSLLGYLPDQCQAVSSATIEKLAKAIEEPLIEQGTCDDISEQPLWASLGMPLLILAFACGVSAYALRKCRNDALNQMQPAMPPLLYVEVVDLDPEYTAAAPAA